MSMPLGRLGREALSIEEKRALAARLLREKAARQPGPAAIARGGLAHHLIERAARREPDREAVRGPGASLTFADLDRAANRLARFLVDLGVGPDSCVGVCLDRTPELVVALLATWKAGGAYLPLDPAYPAERLRLVIDDAAPATILTREALLDRLDDATARAIPWEELDAVFRPGPADPPAVPTTPEHLAYLLYTSGSTGRPKGVMVPHRGLVNYLTWAARAYDAGSGEGAPVHSSVAFDLTVTSLWVPLVAGRRIDLIPESEGVDGLASALRSGRDYGLVKLTPAHLQMLGHQLDGRRPAGRARVFVIGGEALTAEMIAGWRREAPASRLVNEYGPTETVVGCSVYTVPDDGDPPTGPIPIGRPIANTRLYVLDAGLRPVPPGVPGDLYIAGAGVARGYLGRPALTADRFPPDPFAPAAEPGARMYRSGDRARRRPDGHLEYLGRDDDQVKVRGHRIELGDVEAALGAVPGVREAAAAVRGAGGAATLVGYVVADGPGFDPRAVRHRLRDRLPEAMVPSAIVVVDRLPLTPNGKVDRKALPDPDGEEPSNAVASEYVPPSGPVEEGLAALWAGLLGVARVGATDDVFDLGAHSLHAAQAAARARAEFGVDLSVRDVLDEPSVAGLARRVAALRVRAVAEDLPPIVRIPRGGDLPVSHAQEALWLIEQFDPGTPTFHTTAAGRIRGPLDLEVLRRAFAAMLGRHEALRTGFQARDGRPVAVVAAEAPVPLPIVDLEDAGEAELDRRLDAEFRLPFDLRRPPLVRASAFRLGPDDHVIAITMHHIVTDGWSIAVAAEELSALYAAFAEGRPSPLPPLEIQYADYAAWQRSRLSGENRRRLESFWTGALAGVPPLELPTDRPRPPERAARGAQVPLAVPADVTDRLRALGRSEGATLYMTLLAAFQALCGRHSGQSDFAIGTPVANRQVAAVEPLIGYFINVLALRADLSGDPVFRDLLRRVRRATLAAFDHQDLPFDRVVEALKMPRDAGRTPVFQAMFVLQNQKAPEIGRAGLALEPLTPADLGTAKFDLLLALTEGPEGLLGSIEYDAGLFDRPTAERLARHFGRLLRSIAESADRPISRLAMLDDAEVAAEAYDANRTASDVPGEPVHRLIERRARERPDATAAEGEGWSLTYAEMSARADHLAGVLAARGVGPEARVAILLGRSPELPVAQLGVLKAGGAFVPIDPAYPAARVATILAGCAASIVLTSRSLAPTLPEGLVGPAVPADASPGRHSRPYGISAVPERGPEVLILDDGLDREEVAEPRGLDSLDRPAYVMSTSGTTGEPRGVVVTHRNLANHNLATARLFGLTPTDRVLQMASPGFDIAIEETFPTWISGATVVYRGPDATLEPAAFTRWIAGRGLTVLDLPTAYWHAWAEALDRRGLAPPETLRLVVVGGEAARGPALAAWRRATGDRIRWINTYGPTETTVIATADEPGPEGGPGDPPIGRPIANVRAYVLDDALNPVPRGVAGELFVGGLGVARGYLGRPRLTAERFLPDPFAPPGEPGARMYRTGDRVRRRPDGRLTFLGRADGQVKVRGTRVEPGEVEAALLATPGVSGAAVLARPDPAGGARLAAFVVGRVDPESIRRHLRERLPDPMIPRSITVRDALPLTPHGKLDREALAAAEPDAPVMAARVAARTATERALAGLWSEVLGGPAPGVHDDFFEAGGHSLAAFQVVSRVAEITGVEIGLRDLFEAPTLAALADRIDARRGGRFAGVAAVESASSPLILLTPGGDGVPVFAAHPIGGSGLGYLELARRLGDAHPVYAIQAAGLDGEAAPLDDLVAMADRHARAIRAARPEGPVALGGWSFGGVLAFEIARQLGAGGREVAALVMIDAPPPPTPRAPLKEAIEAAGWLRELAGPATADGPGGPLDDAAALSAFARDMALAVGGSTRRVLRGLNGLPPEDRRAAVLRAFGLDGALGPAADERLARLWAVLRANLRALAGYRPGPYPGRIDLIRARGPLLRRLNGSSLGWRKFAEGGVTVHDVPGDHYGLLAPPHVEAVAEAARAALSGGPS